MLASTLFASAAALATTVSAGIVPTFSKRYNITQAWGEWEVTNFTASSHPSSSSIKFSIYWNQGNSGPVTCDASGYSVGGEDIWYDCQDIGSGPFKFSINSDWNDRYQTGSIVHLNGSAPFDIKWGYSSAGSEATAEPFYVPVISESHTLPNGTTTAPEYSSRK